MPIQRRGMRALQIWCERVTSSYSNVKIVDLSSSFRDGLAFCAIIHHFRPELIPEFHSLKSENIVENNALAYRIAEEKLDIPSLLDPEDMAEHEEPDKFSVVTYVSQFYHIFKDADGSRGGETKTTNNTQTRLSATLSSSSSSSGDDSVLDGGSSEASTPAGTPTTTYKRFPGVKTSTPSSDASTRFNQADLIAKYGEEIFSKAPKEEDSLNDSGIAKDSSRNNSPFASAKKMFENNKSEQQTPAWAKNTNRVVVGALERDFDSKLKLQMTKIN